MDSATFSGLLRGFVARHPGSTVESLWNFTTGAMTGAAKYEDFDAGPFLEGLRTVLAELS